jgi:glutamate-ammonia-ligase adenylyltransferase
MGRVQVINQWFLDGRILKLDFRLRAEGASAPLVQDLAFYDDYFRSRASLWERVAFAKCAPWWGGDAIRREFHRRLRSFAARPFTPDQVGKLVEMRRRVESLAPKQFVEWETKRTAGGRYDVEYLSAIGMAATCTDRLDYFTLSTAERVRALVSTGFLSAEEGSTLEGALALFTIVEHLMELQEMTHPGTEEKARRVGTHLSRTLTSLGLTSDDAGRALSETKAGVRRCYNRVLGH